MNHQLILNLLDPESQNFKARMVSENTEPTPLIHPGRDAEAGQRQRVLGVCGPLQALCLALHRGRAASR